MDTMNRKEMLRLLLHQAQFNGFEFRRWYMTHIQPVWPGAEQALTLLAGEGRHYTLLFSHDFARAFWRSGAQISFAVPAITYPRVNGQGKVVQVTRKPLPAAPSNPMSGSTTCARWRLPRIPSFTSAGFFRRTTRPSYAKLDRTWSPLRLDGRQVYRSRPRILIPRSSFFDPPLRMGSS